MRTFLLVLALSLALIPAASASDGPGRGAFGVVTAVSADSITVQPEHDAGLTCRVSADKRDAFAALHVAVGQRVAILCVQDGNQYVLAKISTSAPRPQARERAVEGVVTALSGDSVTVKPSSGDALTCAVGAVRPVGIAVGNRVGMACAFDGARYVLVKIARVPDKPQPPLTRVVRGTVAALSSDSLTVTQENGESVACAIPPGARDRVRELHLAVGDRVVAACTRDGGRWVLAGLKRA
jgi:translation initiation factor IF-1